jgi:hypothetical protein
VSCYLSSCNDSGTCSSSILLSTSGTGANKVLSTVGTPFSVGAYTNAVVLRCSVPGKVGGVRSGIRKYTTYVWH